MRGPIARPVTLALAGAMALACTTAPPPPAPTTPVPTTPTPTAGDTSRPTTLPPGSPPPVSPPPTPAPTAPPTGARVSSDDGGLIVTIPDGAMPGDASASIATLGEPDLPPELVGLPVRSAFYRLEPPQAPLEPAAHAERVLSASALGLDPSGSGLPVLALARRSSDGTWQWLAQQTLAWDGADRLSVSGLLDATGTLMTFGGSSFLSLTADEPDADGRFVLRLTLATDASLPERQRPAIAALDPAAGPPSAVTLRAWSAREVRDPGRIVNEARGRCVERGAPVSVEVRLALHGVHDGSALLRSLGLDPLDVDARLAVVVGC